MKEIYTKVTVYKDVIVVEHQKTESDNIVVTPYDRPGNMGYVVSDIGYVAISKEAHKALSEVKRGRDCIGDLSVFKLGNGLHAFATFGGQCAIFDKNEAVTCRDTVVPAIDNFQVIENIVPEGAINYIDSIDNEDEED